MNPQHLTAALEVVRQCGDRLLKKQAQLKSLTVRDKGLNQLVSEADVEAEEALVRGLGSILPEAAFITEEGTVAQAGEDSLAWIIDPLDGTTNFIHGLPQYAVSIALAKAGQVEQAVVFDPNRNELFTASKGAGAFLNERRIRVSRRTKLQDALIGTGFPYRMFDQIDTYLAIFKELAQKTAGQRRPGAAALDLCYVACGRYDGFWELGLSPWDMAAGSLLISEAGGLVSDLRGEANHLETGNVIAGTPKVFAPLLKLIEEKLPESVRG